MTEIDFRFKHSEIIEYFQLIEMRLRGICAAFFADEERSWFERLDDYRMDPFGILVRSLEKIQTQKQVVVLKKEDFDALDELRESRNYWVHQCFGGPIPIVFRNGEVKVSGYAQRLQHDLDKAIEWDERLTEIGRPLIKHAR